VELSPPEVVFQHAPSPAADGKAPGAGCLRRPSFFKPRCESPKAAGAAYNAVQTTTTVFPSSLVPLDIPAPTVRAATGLALRTQACAQAVTSDAAAQIAALQAYHEIELRTHLQALEEQRRLLSSRLESLNAARRQSLVAGPQGATASCCDQAEADVKALTAQVQQLVEQVRAVDQNQKQAAAQFTTVLGLVVDTKTATATAFTKLADKLQGLDDRIKALEKAQPGKPAGADKK
jgi:hypothetical protein